MKTFVFILFLSVAIGFGTAQRNFGCRDFCEDECIPLGDVECGQLIINTKDDPGGDKCRCQNRCLNRFPSWRADCDVDADCVAPLRCVGANDNNSGRCQPGKCLHDDDCAEYCTRCDGKTFVQCIHLTRPDAPNPPSSGFNCDCQDSCLAGYDEFNIPCTSNNDCGARTVCIEGTCRPEDCNVPGYCDLLCNACDDKTAEECAYFLIDIPERCPCTDTCMRRYDEFRADCDTDNDCLFPLICRGDKCIPDDDCIFVSTEQPPITCEEKCAEACGDGVSQQECSNNILNDIDNLCECQEECLSKYSGWDCACDAHNPCIFPLVCTDGKCRPDDDCEEETDCEFCQSCYIDSCPHFYAHKCNFGVGHDYCGCCPYCLRGPGEYCGGPYDFYGRCGEGFYCKKSGDDWCSVGVCVC